MRSSTRHSSSQWGRCMVITTPHPGFAVFSGCSEVPFGHAWVAVTLLLQSPHSFLLELPAHAAPELVAVSSFWPTASCAWSWNSETARAVLELCWEQHLNCRSRWQRQEQAPKTGCCDAASLELVAALHQLAHVPPRACEASDRLQDARPLQSRILQYRFMLEPA